MTSTDFTREHLTLEVSPSDNYPMSQAKVPDHLKLCLVAQKFPILGRASDHGFLWPIARGLAQRGHSVTVIAAKSRLGKSEVVRDGVRVFYLHEGNPSLSSYPFPDAAYRKFVELHRETPFDLLHSIDSSGFKIAQRKKDFGVGVAYDVEATQMAQLFSIMGMMQEKVGSLLSNGFAMAYKFATTFLARDRKILKTADGVFVTSPIQRTFLERYYLYPEYHTYTVPYGIELGDLSPRPESQEILTRLKLGDHSQIVVTITDMTEPNETIGLLRAFERVAIKKPNAVMIIIGNGPGWKEIEFEMLNLALGSRVHMVGALKPEESSDFIAISDVLINMSSRSTGFETSVIEAMAQKKIIIGSELSPLAEIIADGQDGFLLRPADTLSLSHLLIEIFSGNVPVVDIGIRARDKVTNLFDPQKMISSIETAYRRILQHSKFFKSEAKRPLLGALRP